MPRVSSIPFVCSECGKDFCRKYDLTRHTNTHNSDAKYHSCTFPGCSFISTQKINVTIHNKSIHLKQTHRCSLEGCLKTYKNQSSLIKHKKRVHGLYRKEQNISANHPEDEVDVDDISKKNESEISDTSNADLEHCLQAFTLDDILPTHTPDGPDVFRFSDVL